MPAVAPVAEYRPLSYSDRLEIRSRDDIDLIVIHCTELPDLATAREFGERIHYQGSNTGNSGHYYIDRDGRAECWVATDRVAHHVRNYNERSVGVELVNSGRWPDWLHSACQEMQEPYPIEQITALSTLLVRLRSELDGLRWIAGHEQLDRELVPSSDRPELMVRRKRDPGPRFPWAEVLEATGLEMLPGKRDE